MSGALNIVVSNTGTSETFFSSGNLAYFLEIASLCHEAESVDEITVAVDRFASGNLPNGVTHRFL